MRKEKSQLFGNQYYRVAQWHFGANKGAINYIINVIANVLELVYCLT